MNEKQGQRHGCWGARVSIPFTCICDFLAGCPLNSQPRPSFALPLSAPWFVCAEIFVYLNQIRGHLQSGWSGTDFLVPIPFTRICDFFVGCPLKSHMHLPFALPVSAPCFLHAENSTHVQRQMHGGWGGKNFLVSIPCTCICGFSVGHPVNSQMRPSLALPTSAPCFRAPIILYPTNQIQGEMQRVGMERVNAHRAGVRHSSTSILAALPCSRTFGPSFEWRLFRLVFGDGLNSLLGCDSGL